MFTFLALRSVPKGNRSIDKSGFLIRYKNVVVYADYKSSIIIHNNHKPRGSRVKHGMTVRIEERHYQTLSERCSEYPSLCRALSGVVFRLRRIKIQSLTGASFLKINSALSLFEVFRRALRSIDKSRFLICNSLPLPLPLNNHNHSKTFIVPQYLLKLK